MADVSFLEQNAGAGFEGMDDNDIIIPRLQISQALSDVTQSGIIKVGHFYNSVSNKDYGTSLNVIVCHFEKQWVEWKKNGGGYVGSYPVGGLQGVYGDSYTGLKHQITDSLGNVTENDVIETWNYVCILPEHLSDGYIVFSSTRGNIKYLRAWNTQMRYLKLPSGKGAPIYSSVWNLTLGKDTNKNGQSFYTTSIDGKSSAKWVDWVNSEIFFGAVKPAIEFSQLAGVGKPAAALEAPVMDRTEEENMF